MSGNLRLVLEFIANTANLVNGMGRSRSAVHGFAQGVKNEFAALRGTLNSVQGQLAGIGVSVGVVHQIMESARLDKSLGLIGQTAGASDAQVAGLRGELFRMARDTGKSVDDLKEGFDVAVQSGLKMGEALPVLDAVNKGMAVSTASAQQLTGSLGVAAAAYQFDLAKPGQALKLLDEMVVAGRLGNAELQNLSDIFARVGVNAGSAGMGFEQTLAFIEGLSQVERQPERLATLADSTLRLFTNLDYASAAAKASGVRFFDKKGGQRDPFQVLADLRAKFRALKTEKEQAIWIDQAFGKADQDTKKGLKTLFQGDALDKVKSFTNEIKNATGTIEHDLPKAISNSIDQVGRLKGALRQAADEFAQPINDTLTNLIKFGLDKKENGGLELSGKDILGGAGIGILGTILAARYGGKMIGGLGSAILGTGAGVATGKAVEAATGITPVRVTNWPDNLGGGSIASTAAGTAATAAGGAAAAGWLAKLRPALAILGGAELSTLPLFGAGAVATAAGGVGLAGLAGYGAGSLMYKGIEGTEFADNMGRDIARILALLGNSDARAALDTERRTHAAEGTRQTQDVMAAAFPVTGNLDSARIGTDIGRGVLGILDQLPRPAHGPMPTDTQAATLAGHLDPARIGTDIGDGAKRILDQALSGETQRALDLALKVDNAGAEFARKLQGIDLGGQITLRIEGAPARVTSMQPNNPAMRLNVDAGPTMVLPQ
ncbi:Phage-related minor tail protein [Methylomagnum ishizawai]|uniref:Phage-related minor tail protein n=1 Tax=Methylomagnum ishizawai TaxID=1760988 RepID=A0A1Y6D1T3_9GAMM|nr:phage tail tape measure protein [Methylomagnum ishizawai]SMF94354.1 Phage-related minor tail protein [Methylomagnum ishizawai]